MKSATKTPVVLLCGGKGTRLGDIGKLRPKPLVPIGGMPIVWHIMKAYAAHGFKDFVLCLGYKGELFEELFSRGTIGGEPLPGGEPPKDADWSVVLADTGAETGTSGRVLGIKPHVKEAERFLLTYGDGVSDVDIGALLSFHRKMGKIATVTGVRPETTFGIIREEGGIVTAFAEKPRLDVIINGGFFVMEKQAFDSLDPDGPLEENPLRRLTEARQLAVYRHDGFWQCMDNQKEVEKLNGMWERRERPWAVWERKKQGIRA